MMKKIIALCVLFIFISYALAFADDPNKKQVNFSLSGDSGMAEVAFHTFYDSIPKEITDWNDKSDHVQKELQNEKDRGSKSQDFNPQYNSDPVPQPDYNIDFNANNVDETHVNVNIQVKDKDGNVVQEWNETYDTTGGFEPIEEDLRRKAQEFRHRHLQNYSAAKEYLFALLPDPQLGHSTIGGITNIDATFLADTINDPVPGIGLIEKIQILGSLDPLAQYNNLTLKYYGADDLLLAMGNQPFLFKTPVDGPEEMGRIDNNGLNIRFIFLDNGMVMPDSHLTPPDLASAAQAIPEPLTVICLLLAGSGAMIRKKFTQ